MRTSQDSADHPRTIEWGKEIAVNGKRPAWLRDDDTPVSYPLTDGTVVATLRDMKAATADSFRFEHASKIVLPADHFAYKALDAGFEPWGGDDAPPADWDGDEVLCRTGRTWSGECRWWHIPGDSDIIGYRKRVTEQPADTVQDIKRIVADWLNNPDAPAGYEGLVRFAFQRAGIIKPDPTPLDRFMEANPDADRATAEKALAWKADA